MAILFEPPHKFFEVGASEQDNVYLAPSETWNQFNYFITYSIIIFCKSAF